MPALLALMSELYAESGYELDCVQAERALLASLADERLYSQAEPRCIRASSAPQNLITGHATGPVCPNLIPTSRESPLTAGAVFPMSLQRMVSEPLTLRTS